MKSVFAILCLMSLSCFSKEWLVSVENSNKSKKDIAISNAVTKIPLENNESCELSAGGKIVNGHEIRSLSCGKGDQAFYVTQNCKIDSKDNFDVVVGYKKNMIMIMCGNK